MGNRNNNTPGSEPGIDEEQGQGTDLSFIQTASPSLPSVDDQQNQGPGDSNFSDGSEALFSMYLRRATEEDRKMADSWKGYADGMLVFVSLRPMIPPILLV
jgi:hypothetical protein